MAAVNPNPGFTPESWTLYSVGMLLTVLRLISQIKRFGWKGLLVDDYLVIFGAVWYTVLCVAFNQILVGAGTNLMTDEEIANLTPETKAQRVLGSKWVFVTEHAMLLTIWSMKIALLLLYARLTSGLTNQKKLVKIVGVWTGCGFLGDLLALYLTCRPIPQYWAVPAANPQCSTYFYYQIVNAVFNITTDILIFLLGLPPIFKARLTNMQKSVLSIVFGLGLFVIVAAIMRAIYCTVPALVSYVYMNWYFREASVAVYVTMLPGVWALMRDVFPGLRSMVSRSRSHADGASYPKGQTARSGTGKWRGASKLQSSGRDTPHELSEWQKPKQGTRSTELELGSDDVSADDCSTTSIHGRAAEIRRDVVFTVEYEQGNRDRDTEQQQQRSEFY